MSDTFRLTMAQANPVMGDLRGNADKVRSVWAEAKGKRIHMPNPIQRPKHGRPAKCVAPRNLLI